MSVATEYRDLLIEFVPQPIHSAKQCSRARAKLDKLMVPHPSAAQSLLIEVLATLIEQYESREHPIPAVSPAATLTHLLECKGLKCADLTKKTGIPATTLSNVLAGRRGISKNNARKLGEFFGVSPVVFLD
jgi:HTH-type transcriptional regulator/antitoxin HigA